MKPGQPPLDSLKRGKRTASIDLKHDLGKGIFKRLCAQADVLIEPFRPGVMERLGLGPKPMMDLNKRLVYARLSGFGQDGPYSQKAGHDLNYLAISGVLSLFCGNGKPTAPINMLADFAGGGMTCAMGILIALLERQNSNLGQVIDVSMVEGARYVSSYMWHTQRAETPARQFIWPNQGKKEANLLDGGAHFYTVYKTKDNRWISVAAIEPQFYERLLTVLELNDQDFPQFDIDSWLGFKEKFAQLFSQKTLSEWTELFKNADACVEPVLEYDEVEDNDKLITRSSFNADSTPKPAPILSRTPAQPNLRDPVANEHTAEVLKEHGYGDREIMELNEKRVIDCNMESKL